MTTFDEWKRELETCPAVELWDKVPVFCDWAEEHGPAWFRPRIANARQCGLKLEGVAAVGTSRPRHYYSITYPPIFKAPVEYRRHPVRLITSVDVETFLDEQPEPLARKVLAPTLRFLVMRCLNFAAGQEPRRPKRSDIRDEEVLTAIRWLDEYRKHGGNLDGPYYPYEILDYPRKVVTAKLRDMGRRKILEIRNDDQGWIIADEQAKYEQRQREYDLNQLFPWTRRL